MRCCALMRYYQSFPTAIPLYEAGYPRVTHPSAAQSNRSSSEESDLSVSLDLHVLGTPPAFILSQDQTLIKSFPEHSESSLACFINVVYCNLYFYWNKGLHSLNNLQKNFQGLVHCLVFKFHFAVNQQLLYLITRFLLCQQLFSFFYFLFCKFAAVPDGYVRITHLFVSVNWFFKIF